VRPTSGPATGWCSGIRALPVARPVSPAVTAVRNTDRTRHQSRATATAATHCTTNAAASTLRSTSTGCPPSSPAPPRWMAASMATAADTVVSTSGRPALSSRAGTRKPRKAEASSTANAARDSGPNSRCTGSAGAARSRMCGVYSSANALKETVIRKL